MDQSDQDTEIFDLHIHHTYNKQLDVSDSRRETASFFIYAMGAV